MLGTASVGINPRESCWLVCHVCVDVLVTEEACAASQGQDGCPPLRGEPRP